MSSLVLELQREILGTECDVVNVLRKAHLIATKLNLDDFDLWIRNELNGYKCSADEIPDYRQMKGELKAKNPTLGWIPAVITGKNTNQLSIVPMFESISALIEVAAKTKDGCFYYSYPPELSMKICQQAHTPTYMEIAVHISTYRIYDAVEQIKNRILEWTLKLESEGIVGENMSFNQEEKDLAKSIPQQINYYGPVFNGDVSESQIVTGDNNSNTYNVDVVRESIKEIRESLEKEKISAEDMESAIEMLEDISDKLAQNKKPSIIKSALVGLKDFVIASGANITAALITTKMQGLF